MREGKVHMRQLSLRASLGCDEERSACMDNGTIEVWDLFCGAGGFSEGARAAGCRVAFACDSNEEAIKTHRRNHPETVHRCCELPCELPLPTDGRLFHLHGSPPCQRFSKINKNNKYMHLTNYSINKKNDKFIQNENCE